MYAPITVAIPVVEDTVVQADVLHAPNGEFAGQIVAHVAIGPGPETITKVLFSYGWATPDDTLAAIRRLREILTNLEREVADLIVEPHENHERFVEGCHECGVEMVASSLMAVGRPVAKSL